MSVAATRNCCAALKPMPNTSMPSDQTGDAMEQHRYADGEAADQCQRQAELDAGLAAVAVGDLADRVGNEEPA